MELLAVAVEQALSLCSGDGGRVVVVERASSALIVFILELFKNVNF